MPVSSKQIRDPVYGFIHVPEEFIKIIDHPLFQRLRWISQMGLAQMVFPGAVHTRFEHCLGTFHLAGIAASSLIDFCKSFDGSSYLKESKVGQEFLNILKYDEEAFIKAACAVALLHDVGHAPFSHTFEIAIEDYDHEQFGFKIAAIILEDTECMSQTWAKWALEVLNKQKPVKELEPQNMVLRSLIDGPIDVDKGDYLVRDSYHCGVQYGGYGQDRLWRNLAILTSDIEGTEILQLGVTSKGAYEAYHLLMARFHMYEAVYEHHTKQKIDAVVAAMLRQIKSFIYSPEMLRNFDKQNLNKDLNKWTDGYIIFGLLTFPTSPFLKSLMQKLYARQLPQKSKKLSEITIPCHREKVKEISSQLKKKIWSLQEEMEVDLFPYLYRPQDPFPLRSLYSVSVFSEDGQVSSLYDFLKLNMLFPALEEVRDPDKLRSQELLVLRAFSYSDDFSSDTIQKWQDLGQIALIEPEL